MPIENGIPVLTEEEVRKEEEKKKARSGSPAVSYVSLKYEYWHGTDEAQTTPSRPANLSNISAPKYKPLDYQIGESGSQAAEVDPHTWHTNPLGESPTRLIEGLSPNHPEQKGLRYEDLKYERSLGETQKTEPVNRYEWHIDRTGGAPVRYIKGLPPRHPEQKGLIYQPLIYQRSLERPQTGERK
jgi:hypothetical protein